LTPARLKKLSAKNEEIEHALDEVNQERKEKL